MRCLTSVACGAYISSNIIRHNTNLRITFIQHDTEYIAILPRRFETLLADDDHIATINQKISQGIIWFFIYSGQAGPYHDVGISGKAFKEVM